MSAQIAGTWYPVAVDGVAVDAAQRDSWWFGGTDTNLQISGYDGCNRFGNGSGPDPALIVDARLDNVVIGSETQDCGDDVHGPYPETGAVLTVSDDGTALTSDGPSGTVALSRTAPGRAGSDSLPPAPDPDAGTFDLSPANPQPGESFEATFEPDNERGGYFTLEQWSGSEWLPAVFLLESDAETQPASWSSIGDGVATQDYGIEGPGPDGLVMPDDIDSGIWRLCTANARDETCAQLTIHS